MKSKRKRLEDKAWQLFSLNVRLGAANSMGMCECYTCRIPKDWKHNTDAGHWQGRGKKPTKYDVDNVRCQCKQCNKWGHPRLSKIRGEPLEFEKRLREDGVDTEALQLKARTGKSMTLCELEDFIVELKITLRLTIETATRRGVCDAVDALRYCRGKP